MIVRQSALFARTFKKIHKEQRNAVRLEVQRLVENPKLGVQKKQDLREVFVHKFKISNQLFLLAYTFDPETLDLIMLGVHENFYRDLKKYIN